MESINTSYQHNFDIPTNLPSEFNDYNTVQFAQNMAAGMSHMIQSLDKGMQSENQNMKDVIEGNPPSPKK